MSSLRIETKPGFFKGRDLEISGLEYVRGIVCGVCALPPYGHVSGTRPKIFVGSDSYHDLCQAELQGVDS